MGRWADGWAVVLTYGIVQREAHRCGEIMNIVRVGHGEFRLCGVFSLFILSLSQGERSSLDLLRWWHLKSQEKRKTMG